MSTSGCGHEPMFEDACRAWEADFAAAFGAAPEVAVRAPGRVNLIGDHTDNHEGFVLPLAIERATVLLGRRRADRRVCVHSLALDAGVTLDLDDDERHPERWARYFQGVIRVYARERPLLTGCDVLVAGDLPPGAGLASSSALVVGFAALLAWAQGEVLDPLALATLGRDAEHWYGTTGGIMDHFTIGHGRTGHALLLDCRTLWYEPVPLPEGVALVIAHTGTQHNQLVSPFAARRREAEAGLRVLQEADPAVRTLRDADPNLLERCRPALLVADPSGTLLRRCRHVVTEDARVRDAAAALARGDLATVGRLMAASHASLRDDYEVSCPELDAMVAAARASPGFLGGRLTGGGFGGCTVNLVAADAVAAFRDAVAARYERATGLAPALFTTRPAAGLARRTKD
ncbi:MAG TPA: galactokinase [Thermomicrobiales bacterium]|nr:galactokinase [Thermomicrobiales bacterium]